VLYFRVSGWFRNGHRIITYRIDKVEPFKAGWRGGYADFQLCHNVKGAFRYISKYLAESVLRGEGNKTRERTLALSWFFHKRSFSISGDIAQVYSDLILSPYGNSNAVVPYFRLLDGSTLKCEVSKWKLYGFVKGDHVKWGCNFREIDVQR
jgi:hypothetical protein